MFLSAKDLLRSRNCPNCFHCGKFRRHATYRKYHFGREILIVRVRCDACRVTHALIPSFSLPGTSMGTQEAEEYLRARSTGDSRRVASASFATFGLGPRYAKHLERMFERAVSSGKTLFPRLAENRLEGVAWIASMCGAEDRPLYRINCFGLQHRVNGLCFCRRWFLKYYRNPLAGNVSHNPGSAPEENPDLDSG